MILLVDPDDGSVMTDDRIELDSADAPSLHATTDVEPQADTENRAGLWLQY